MLRKEFLKGPVDYYSSYTLSKSMRKIHSYQWKKFPVCKTFDRKRYRWYEFEDFQPKAVRKRERKTPKTKYCLKKSTLPVKKSRQLK